MIEIRLLLAGDESLLATVADDVFDNPVDPKLSAAFLADPRHHMVVALDQGCGIGKRLVVALVEHGQSIGCKTAWVLTEASNSAACALYNSAGGAVTAEP